MNAGLLTAGGSPARPSLRWWVLLALALVLGFALGPLAAFALLTIVTLQLVRPLDFFTAYLLVVTGASFVNYTRGGLTGELSLLSVGLLFMLFCYTLRPGRRLLAAPLTPVTLPLLLYLGLSCANFVRGLLAGNSPRYAGLGILAVLALGSCLLVANQFRRRDLGLAYGWLWVTALGHSALGFYVYSILKVRTGSIYFTPVPGVIAVLLLNRALRAGSSRRALLWTCATLPLLLHQFLSFTRGYWLSIMASLLFTIAVFVGRGPAWPARLRRSAAMLGTVVVVGVVGAVVIAEVYGIRGLGELALSRLSSSTGTQYSFETSSNIVRLVEAAKVFTEIAAAPLQGHGIGHSFVVREPIHLQMHDQWFCHENYLLVWMTQGLIGLGLFVWMLFAAVRMGLAGRRREDPGEAAWVMGTAAATVYVIVYNLVHFPLGEVNTTFTLALMWGCTMSLTASGWRELRWGPARPGTESP